MSFEHICLISGSVMCSAAAMALARQIVSLDVLKNKIEFPVFILKYFF